VFDVAASASALSIRIDLIMDAFRVECELLWQERLSAPGGGGKFAARSRRQRLAASWIDEAARRLVSARACANMGATNQETFGSLTCNRQFDYSSRW
jgi:hypothetical protein